MENSPHPQATATETGQTPATPVGADIRDKPTPVPTGPEVEPVGNTPHCPGTRLLLAVEHQQSASEDQTRTAPPSDTAPLLLAAPVDTPQDMTTWVAGWRKRHASIKAQEQKGEEEKRTALIENYLEFRRLGGVESQELRAQVEAHGILVKARQHPELPFIYLFTGMAIPSKGVADKKATRTRRQATEQAAFWGAIGSRFSNPDLPTVDDVKAWVTAQGTMTDVTREYVKARRAMQKPGKPELPRKGERAEEPNLIEAALASAEILATLPATDEKFQALPRRFAAVLEFENGQLCIKRALRDYAEGLSPYEPHMIRIADIPGK